MQRGEGDVADERAVRDEPRAEPFDDARVEWLDSPMKTAISANSAGNSASSSKTSTKTCWAEVMKPKSPPIATACASM
ncbi:MAG: hypothetical protein U1F24_08260 [Alphaproteobacteria bacterium]